MYKSFSILRFRGLTSCNLEGMRRVTLLTGKNNAGKTAVLEAMFIHSGGHRPNLVMVVNAIRGVSKVRVDTASESDPPWLSAFTGYDDTHPIQLTGQVSTKQGQYEAITMKISTVKTHTELSGFSSQVRNLPFTAEGLTSKILKLELIEGKRAKSSKYFLYFDNNQQVVFPTSPMLKFQTRFISAHNRNTAEEQATQFAGFQIAGTQELLMEALREIEPRLKKLELVFSGEPMIHGDIGLPDRRMIPLAVMGDGTNRVASLVLAIGNTRGGVVLVDDIDTGLHHSVMPKFWATVMKAAKTFNVQVVATTHSDECVKAALSASKDQGSDDLSLIRMERQNDQFEAFTYDSEEIEAAFSTGLEVR